MKPTRDTNYDYINHFINILLQSNNFFINLPNLYHTCKNFYNIKTKFWNLNKIKSNEFINNKNDFRKNIYDKITNSLLQLSINYYNKYINGNDLYLQRINYIYRNYSELDLSTEFSISNDIYFLNEAQIINFNLFKLTLSYAYVIIEDIRIDTCVIYDSYIYDIDIKSQINNLNISNSILLNSSIIDYNFNICCLENTNIKDFSCKSTNVTFVSCDCLETINLPNVEYINIIDCTNIKKLNISKLVKEIIIRCSFNIFTLCNITYFTNLLHLRIEDDDSIECLNIESLQTCYLCECVNLKSLSNCKNLEVLDIKYNYKLTSLDNLDKLHTLNMLSMNIDNLYLCNLKMLSITACNNIQKINTKNLKNLINLTIHHSNNVNNISCHNLSYLKVEGNIKCTKLHLKNLIELELVHTNIRDFTTPKLKICKLENINLKVFNNDSLISLRLINIDLSKIHGKNIKDLSMDKCNNIIRLDLTKLIKLRIVNCANIRVLSCPALEKLKIDTISRSDYLIDNLDNLKVKIKHMGI